VAIRFLSVDGKEEKAAFRIPLPAQWVAAMNATLVRDRPLTPSEPKGSEAPSAEERL